MRTLVSLVWFGALAVCAIPSLAVAKPAAAPAKPAAAKPAVGKPAAATPAAATSGPKPLPASQHTPPVILDEASAQIALVGRSDNGYVFRSHIEMTGFTSNTDTAHIDWKQGGKVLASAKCSFDRDGAYASGSCNYDGTPIKTLGDIDAELIYWDDQTEKNYLVRTFKVTAHHLKGQWETWQISPDDLLASAWMYMAHDDDNNGTYRRPALYIWFSTGDTMNDGTLRCTVDGKKLEDIGLSPEGGPDTGEIEGDYQPNGGERLTYKWEKMKFLVDVMWGKRSTLKWDMPQKTPKDKILSDNPGKWECKLRHDGKAVRLINFSVDKDGMILQDEIQTGTGAIPVVSPRVVLVDVRLTPDSQTFDKRIVPEALKKSMGFGLPWPVHPKVKTIQASYPPKSGMPDPK